MITDILNGFLEWLIGLMRDTTWDIVSAFLADQMLRFPDWLTDQAAIINGRMTVLAMTVYGVVVVIGGFMVMSNESIQSTYSAREVVPRLVTGFLLAALSWTLIENMQMINNEIVAAMTLGNNAEPDPELDTENANFWTAFALGNNAMSMPVIELCVAVLMLIAICMLFLTMLTRNVVWFLVASFAPIALVCHSLPFTEGAAMLWWRLMFACMASSIGQASLIWTWQTLFQGIEDTEVIASYSYKPFFVLALVWAIWKVHKMAFVWARGTPLRIPGGRLVKGLVKTAVIGAILKSNPLGAAVGAAAKRLPFLKGLAGKLNPAKPRTHRPGAATGPGRSQIPPVRRGNGRGPKNNQPRGGPKSRGPAKNRPSPQSGGSKRANAQQSANGSPPRKRQQDPSPRTPRTQRTGGSPPASQSKSPNRKPPNAKKPQGRNPSQGNAANGGKKPAADPGQAQRSAPKPKWRPENDGGPRPDQSRKASEPKRKWTPNPKPRPKRGGKWSKS
jgi:hypothetical protein